MATLHLGKAHFSIGAHEHTPEERPGFISILSPFMVCAQATEDRHVEYWFRETGWRGIHP